jgi:hypothetical protein
MAGLTSIKKNLNEKMECATRLLFKYVTLSRSFNQLLEFSLEDSTTTRTSNSLQGKPDTKLTITLSAPPITLFGRTRAILVFTLAPSKFYIKAHFQKPIV